MREENEDGLRNFLIDLPTGARHCNPEQSQIDVAQAERSASCMAALMARALPSRNPKHWRSASVPPVDHLLKGLAIKRILIVEDQTDIRKLIRMTLEFESYEIYEATSGDFGLRMASAVRPDLVLLDVMMPGKMDGLQVCQAIKSNPALASMKVVLLTACGQSSDREAGKQAGADEYLVKPFSPLQLMDTVERLMAAA